MFRYLAHKIIGTKNDRELKRIRPIVARIAGFEPAIQACSDADLRNKTIQFKERIAHGEPLDAILPEAFAVVREAARRAIGLRHFDAQMIGGMTLHEGKIAEMKTGEGKTLVATLPVYLNALAGKGVHVITVNDYLARRDAEWMGPVYKFLGLSVGVIVHGLSDTERQWAYRADCTYGTNNEFGFDYLRDNMKFGLEQYAQRELNYAIVDEVDSILIDEARTPLIISGPSEESTDLYYQVNQVIPFLKKGDHYTVDEKARTVVLTEHGVSVCEGRLNVENLFDPRNISLVHHVNQALRAHVLFKRDVDYVVKEDKVTIVDEFTGRLMPGRRWSDGLHQAVEAKEGVRIENENQTLATITFQNYFRMYAKLAGMTGTADTEAAEFAKIYNLEVMIIPTHRPMVRKDQHDVIYKTEAAKFSAAVAEIKECHAKGQPVLVGTISIEKSERLSGLLKRDGVPHHVLNAKQHEREAEIVAQAGRKGAVTISTNMAGRGTDIVLGGNPEFMARARVADGNEEAFRALLEEFRAKCAAERAEVVTAGGLHIMGTERHESRRIDNQLRGRSGRQGDPGSSRFYLSLEDDLLRIFGGGRIKTMMERFGMKDDEVIEHPWLNRAIANAQKKVEEHNFSIRKSLIEYDDVMNLQRKKVYGQRRQILATEDTRDLVLDIIDQVVSQVVDQFVPERADRRAFDAKPFLEKVHQQFDLRLELDAVPPDHFSRDGLGEYLYHAAEAAYRAKEELYGVGIMRQVEKYILLTTLDALWKDHLLQMDHLKEGIGLRGYAQRDPLVEYKKEAYNIFRFMMDSFAADSVEKLFRVQVRQEEAAAVPMPVAQPQQQVTMAHGETSAFDREQKAHPYSPSPIPQKAGRNDPCPCGSGKKYKKCHGM